MPFAILLLDSNYLTSAKHSPKKWNVNYITVAGLTDDEQARWDSEYGPDWSSVDSELSKELVVVSRMLNTLDGFGYKLINSMNSNPRIAYKDTENNRECYIWNLYKPSAPSKRLTFRGQEENPDLAAASVYCGQLNLQGATTTSVHSSQDCCCNQTHKDDCARNKNSSLGPIGLQMSKEIENTFRIMSAKEKLQLSHVNGSNVQDTPTSHQPEELRMVNMSNVKITEISEI